MGIKNKKKKEEKINNLETVHQDQYGGDGSSNSHKLLQEL